MTKKKTPLDYKFLKLLGEGSFSSVYLAVDATTSQANLVVKQQPQDDLLFDDKKQQKQPDQHQSEQQQQQQQQQQQLNKPTHNEQTAKARKYAIKVCQKSYIKRQGKQAAIMREKEIMNILNENPNKHFIKLYCTFQDSERLYFVMTYAENGDLLTFMLENPLSLDVARKYTQQLVEALEHLHKLNLIHRDLKPENILLDDDMNIMISDFGSAQIYILNDGNDGSKTGQDRRNSFVGTAQYVSPEMLKNRQASNKSDLWALGIILYQMITNVMPFNAPNEYLIYQKIHNLEYEFPEDFDASARDLVSSLIKLEPLERLGALDDFKKQGYVSIREHEFMKQQQDQAATTSGYAATTICNNIAREPDECFTNIDKIRPGFDEAQVLRLLTLG